jgi:hypothetical protein
MDDEEYLGYLKLQGKSIEDGLLDARKASQALLGFDEAIRFFIGQQVPALRDAEYEIPVRLKKGSWEALIPQTIIEWVGTILGAGATTYVVTAAKKLAENDTKEKRTKDLFIHALEGIQWLIRIGKHLGDITYKKFENVRFRKENTEIGIPNHNNEYLYIPKKYFDFFVSSSPKLLQKIAKLVEVERGLEIGVYKDNQLTKEQLTTQHKYIFTMDEDDIEDFLFPELTHGMPVELLGHITRGNENTNTLGFRFKGHILTCHPESGNIVQYKSTLYLDCRVFGFISRLDKFGGHNEVKPKIIFNRIDALDTNDKNLPLL